MRAELQQGAPERHSAKQPQVLRWFPRELAREQPKEPQALRAVAQELVRQVSAALRPVPTWQLVPESGARFSLSLPRSSPLPPRLPPRPIQGNASVPARHARYQSSSSASSSL